MAANGSPESMEESIKKLTDAVDSLRRGITEASRSNREFNSRGMGSSSSTPTTPPNDVKNPMQAAFEEWQMNPGATWRPGEQRANRTQTPATPTPLLPPQPPASIPPIQPYKAGKPKSIWSRIKTHGKSMIRGLRQPGGAKRGIQRASQAFNNVGSGLKGTVGGAIGGGETCRGGKFSSDEICQMVRALDDALTGDIDP